MAQHDSSIAQRSRLRRWAPLGALAGAFLAAASCSHLQQPDNPLPVAGDGGGSSGGGSGSSSGSGSGASGSSSGLSSGSGSSSGASSGADMVVDGAPPDVGKISCGASTETLTYATGYTPDPTMMATAATMAGGMSTPALASQMRGTNPGSGTTPNTSDIFRTLDDSANSIRGFLFRDGPRGVNLQAQLPMGQNGYSTSFPVPEARAASWDLDLENKIGADTGDETLASGNTMLLAPVINILRHPAWGRAQETYGEDSFLLGRFGSAYTLGVQQYIPACAKHYAANNIEDGRAAQNASMDEQTLHEIYGRQYEMVIQDGGVACVMAAYNAVNGTKSTLNKELLTDMLRSTFGFKGFVLSDWWAMPPGQNAAMSSQLQMYAQQGVTAGLDMELPWDYNYGQLETVATHAQLVNSAQLILAQKMRFQIIKTGVQAQQLGLNRPSTMLDNTGSIANNQAHIADALQSAVEGMVLLKNQMNTLPIKRSSVHTIAVIGSAVGFTLTNTSPNKGTVNFATDVRLGDLGSSRVFSDPAKSYGPAAGIQQVAGTGINVVSGTDPALANNADFVVVVAGLTPQDEGEEYTGAGDRSNFDLDGKSAVKAQDNLILAVAGKGKPMAVVLEGGSVINMSSWLGMVPAVVMAWYPGMVGGQALGKLLFGDENFSGKLPLTWPQAYGDEPPFNQGGATGGTTTMDYYLGYRYFDKNAKTPLYAFGYGLGYTTFKYQYIGVPCSTVPKNGVVDVSVEITNTGSVPGNEVSFLFVSYPSTQARRSVKELKGFHRTTAPVMPGQTVQFTIPLRVSDLKYWNVNSTPPGWTVESGLVQIMVGPSSDNLPLKDMMTVQ